jgi:hypothetical protein
MIVRTLSYKRTVVASLAALTMVAAAIGVVDAQAPAASPSPSIPAPAGPNTQQPAAKPGQPGGDHQARHEQFLNALATKLNVTPERLKQAMEETRTELGLPEGGPKRGGGRLGPGLDAAAQAIGISVDQLRQELPGKSLTDVAQAHNVSPTTVATALKTAANSHIDQAAAAGRIPSDQVAQAKQQAAERIDQMMTRQMPTGTPPAGGPSH